MTHETFTQTVFSPATTTRPEESFVQQVCNACTWTGERRDEGVYARHEARVEGRIHESRSLADAREESVLQAERDQQARAHANGQPCQDFPDECDRCAADFDPPPENEFDAADRLRDIRKEWS